MISGRTLLLMHIPKTAGTSLCWIASQQYTGSDFRTLYPGHASQINELIRATRSSKPPRAILGHFWFGLHSQIPRECVYYTVLRNPIEQVISHYNHLSASDDPAHHAVLRKGNELSQFVEHDWGSNLQTQYVAGMSRAEIDADPEGAFLCAKEYLHCYFAGVGIVEQFDSAICHLGSLAGWQIPKVPQLNRMSDRPIKLPRTELSPLLEARIRETNRIDIRLYEYVSNRLRDGVWVGNSK